MSQEIEIEKTYLAKFLPADLKTCKSKKIVDTYFPKNSQHAVLRLRQSDKSYYMTKKTALSENNASTHLEDTIDLSLSEFKTLSKVSGYKIPKIRYYYPYKKHVAEIDVYSGELKGLVLVDFEFKNHAEFNSFAMPDFCLADVTEKEIFAGGVLCRQTMKSLAKTLKKFSYENPVRR